MLKTAVQQSIRIVIVDDHPVVRDGVSSQLRSDPDISVVGCASSGTDAVGVCADTQPDVVLLDLRLPDALAADVVPRLHAVAPQCRILLFTAFPEHIAVAASLSAGACGVLVKDSSGTALRNALHEVVATGEYDRVHSALDGSATASTSITRREYQVLRLVAGGQTNREIGDELYLSPNTVKAYLSNVMHKLQARNRAQLITNARTSGLL